MWADQRTSCWIKPRFIEIPPLPKYKVVGSLIKTIVVVERGQALTVAQTNGVDYKTLRTQIWYIYQIVHILHCYYKKYPLLY